VAGYHLVRIVFEVCVVASNYPHEDPSPNEGGEAQPELPSRTGGSDYSAHTEARAEVRDRETYYTELRFAVHCQSRSIPVPRAALEDEGPDIWPGRSQDDAWDEIVARFGDTWT
jgi:hypothetical protein